MLWYYEITRRTPQHLVRRDTPLAHGVMKGTREEVETHAAVLASRYAGLVRYTVSKAQALVGKPLPYGPHFLEHPTDKEG